MKKNQVQSVGSIFRYAGTGDVLDIYHYKINSERSVFVVEQFEGSNRQIVQKVYGTKEDLGESVFLLKYREMEPDVTFSSEEELNTFLETFD